jgi:hypothetical protein
MPGRPRPPRVPSAAVATGAANPIWTQVNRTSTHDVVHLINLQGYDTQWRNTGREVLHGPGRQPDRAYVASPDRDHGQATSLSYSTCATRFGNGLGNATDCSWSTARFTARPHSTGLGTWDAWAAKDVTST